MTDLELIKKCADRMGINVRRSPHWELEHWEIEVFDGDSYEIYDPLEDDAQAMALLFLLIEQEWAFTLRANLVTSWSPHHGSHCQSLKGSVTPESLRRFFCECVAKLEK